MIDPANKLYVFHDDNGSFSDHSDSAADYVRDEYSVQMVAAEDYMYFGFDRPFGSIYNEIVTANSNSNSLSLEYNNGTSWVSLGLTDETNGMTRSGYMIWSRPSDWAASTVNSQEAFYVRIRPDVDHTAVSIRGQNLVLSDDNMLKQEFFEIDNINLLPPGESSHIVNHVAARNKLVQSLRNRGYIKTDSSSNKVNLTYWDILDIFEVRQAATMLCLSTIFFNLSDSTEDNWWQKYREYQDKYEESFRLVTLSIDNDNDGLADDDETAKQFKSMRWGR